MNKSKKSEAITKYMTPISKLITFNQDTDIKDAVSTIIKHKISGAPVLNERGEMIGILSEKDCLKMIIGSDYYELPPDNRKVVEYMTKAVKTLPSACTVIEAAFEFMHTNYKRFPVVAKGKLVGQISRRDILKAIDF